MSLSFFQYKLTLLRQCDNYSFILSKECNSIRHYEDDSFILSKDHNSSRQCEGASLIFSIYDNSIKASRMSLSCSSSSSLRVFLSLFQFNITLHGSVKMSFHSFNICNFTLQGWVGMSLSFNLYKLSLSRQCEDSLSFF